MWVGNTVFWGLFFFPRSFVDAYPLWPAGIRSGPPASGLMSPGAREPAVLAARGLALDLACVLLQYIQF